MGRKLKPHYDLNELKELLQEDDTGDIVGKARKTAVALGYSEDDVIRKVLELQPKHFFLSKTAFHDPKLWHDYYRLPDDDKDIDLFIKLQKGHDGVARVTSFTGYDEEYENV
ncbi:MAG: type II toxin-antitoxin system MqsR family toxin [bacterium]|nr:type II toxin-antitoxin system MqsR family toxin [bacterium]MDT8365876.1 type II toxin-antitoxin system MqsR family toxin [bacterium]